MFNLWKKMIKTLFRKKNVGFIHDVSDHSKLSKTLGAIDLLFIGIGAVIGTGIFVLTGIHAAQTAGPAISVSFILAGITCIFVALIYTEVASSVPSSGGSYTYAYVAIGEPAAWLVGWIVIAQLICACTAVASGWSGYIMGIFKQLNITILPEMLTKKPIDGGIIDIPAIFIVIVITLVLIKGIKESTRLNAILVFLKMAAIFLFLVIALPDFKLENWSNFMPFGVNGVALAAGSLFFAYTGFDAIANAAEECKNPEKDVTIGLIGSILISTVLYTLVAAMLTGIAHYSLLNNAEPLAYALKINGSNIGGALVATGGIAGMTTVILFQIYAATRIGMAMSRDGLIPKVFSKVHPKFLTPHVSTLVIGGVIAMLAGFAPINVMGDLNSIGALSALLFVIISGLRLRSLKPNIKRPFRCPMIYLVSAIGGSLCAYLIFKLLETVGWIFAGWIVAGIVVYFLYSRKRATRVYNKNH